MNDLIQLPAIKEILSLKGNHHDNTFKAAMSLPHIYLTFFKQYLPPTIAAALDFESIIPDETNYVDEGLQAKFCDKVYKVSFGNESGHLVLIAEHQSEPDQWLPLRVWRYMHTIFDYATIKDKKNKNENKPLPMIYPIVLYHGEYPYNCSKDIQGLIEAPPSLLELVWGKPIQLIDLTQIDDETLLAQGNMGVLHYTFKHIRAKQFEIHFRKILQHIDLVVPIEKQSAVETTRLLKILIRYTECKANIDKASFLKCLREAPINNDTRSEVMTVLEQVKQEGIAEGIAKGIAEGKAEGKAEGIAEGIAKGIIEGKCKVATQMIRAGMSIEQVIQCTGLLEKMIYELAEDL